MFYVLVYVILAVLASHFNTHFDPQEKTPMGRLLN